MHILVDTQMLVNTYEAGSGVRLSLTTQHKSIL